MKNPKLKSYLLVFSLTIGQAICISVPINAEEGIWEPIPLTRIIEEAFAHNEEIKSLESKLASFREEIDFAGSLNDPMIGFGIANLPVDTFRFDQEPMTQKQIFFTQKVPWFGELNLKSKKSSAKVIYQEAILTAKKLSLARQIADTYYQLGFIASSEKINERLRQMVTQLLKASETRYAAGRGLQQDVFQAQVELSKLLDEKIMLSKNHRTLEDRINELLNREQFMPVEPPENLPYMDINLEVETLTDLAMTVNPGLNVRIAEIAMAEMDIELAEKSYKPDMEFKIAYGQRDDSPDGQDRADFLSASVAMSIPLWFNSRQDNKLAAARENHQAAIHSYRSMAKALPHKIDALTNEIRNIQKNYRLFADDLMVQGAQWAQSSLSAYEVGKLEFNSMITAQIRLLRLELTAEKYLYDLYRKRAELEEVIGQSLNPKDVAYQPSDMTKMEKLENENPSL